MAPHFGFFGTGFLSKSPPPYLEITYTTFFERRKRRFKRHSKLLIIQNSSQIKAEDVLCGSCMQPKKQFKVQIIGILEEIDSFY